MAELKQAFADDPVYSIFGLDSPEYIAAAFAGGIITSIHRKIGDAYEDCVRIIFSTQYHLTAEQVRYTALISSGDRQLRRSLDVYFALKDIPRTQWESWTSYADAQLKQISPTPKVDIEAIGFEVRHCYQSADSKRAQADEAMARHCIVSGILPVMLIFCAQSNRSVITRYRSLWVVTEGHASYDLIKAQTGFDFYAFLLANKKSFRQPIVEMLKRLRET
ncbi:MAG: hypothetical protein FJ014_04540 [Chloroflexi bacterium]|nr:hypothetical protein [Chloroflexota bacterium]